MWDFPEPSRIKLKRTYLGRIRVSPFQGKINGGPLYDDEFRVVGLFNSVKSSNGGTGGESSAYAVSMHDIYDDLNTENIASLKIGQWVDGKYVRDGEDLFNGRLVYRSLFPRVFKRDGTGKKKKTCYFFATADVNSTQDPKSLLVGKKAHFKIEYKRPEVELEHEECDPAKYSLHQTTADNTPAPRTIGRNWSNE